MIKRLMKGLIDPVLARTWQLGPLRRNSEAYDLIEIATLMASVSSAEYYVSKMQGAKLFASDLDLLAFAAKFARVDGLVLEFGVASGRTIRHLARIVPHVHGFDAFTGLPEDWRPGFEAGRFAQRPPEVPGNVSLHVGLFAATLPSFLTVTQGEIAMLHIDCDLYSATQDIFVNLAPRLRSGSIIVFDEYFNYPGWQEHEYRAFQEFVTRTGVRYRYLGVVPSSHQVAVILL